MRLQIYPTSVAIIPRPTGDLHDLIAKAFSWPHPDAYHIRKHHRETKHPEPSKNCWLCNWDGQLGFYKYGKLPIGFFNELRLVLNREGQAWEVDDKRAEPGCAFDWHLSARLRAYQEDVVKRIPLNEMGIISAATGSGKTIIAAAIICKLGIPTIIIVPTKVIFGQFLQTLREFTDCPVGEIGSGKWEEAPVNVAIAATLAKHKDRAGVLLAGKQLLIIDEFHISAAETWQEIVEACPAYYRYGMSATPFRATELEDQTLRSMVGDVIAEVPTGELQEQGYLSKTDIRIIKVPCHPTPRVWDEDAKEWRFTTYGEKYREVIVENIERNWLIAQISNHHYSNGDKILISVAWKEHAEALIPLLEGIPLVYLSGADSRKRTEEKRQQFLAMEAGVCIGTPVLDIGFDVPSIDILVLAGGGEYRGRQQQRLGRGLRIAPGKGKLIAYDFLDDDGHTTRKIFRRHSRSRCRTYRELGQEPVTYQSVEEAIDGKN